MKGDLVNEIAEVMLRSVKKEEYRADPSEFLNNLSNPPLPIRKTKGKLSVKRLNARERMIRALQLRLAGYNFEEIAGHLGYAGRPQAYKAVKTLLDETQQAPADELRTLESARLDQLISVLWVDSLLGDKNAMDRIIRLLERKAKLLGLDAPVKVENIGLPQQVRILNEAKVNKADG